MVSPKDLRRARLAFDYRVVKEMARSSSLIDLQAFSSRHDLEKRRRPICDDGQGETAGYYLVHYNVRSLVGRGKYHTGFDVVFDLMSEKTYPKARATTRSAQVASSQHLYRVPLRGHPIFSGVLAPSASVASGEAPTIRCWHTSSYTWQDCSTGMNPLSPDTVAGMQLPSNTGDETITPNRSRLDWPIPRCRLI